MEEKNTKINAIFGKVVEFFNNNKRKCIIGIIAVVAIILLIAIISALTGGKAGNTPGNLQAGGFAADAGSWTYYVKLDDGDLDGIYKVKGTKTEEVTDAEGMYINVVGSKIYYAEADEDSYEVNIVKMNSNGKDKETIVKDISECPVTVVDGWIYYAKDDNFYRIKTNGKDREKISSKDISSYQVEGNWIYYSYYDDGEYVIAKMKTDGEDNTRLSKEASSTFYVKGGTIYYIKSEYNDDYEYEYTLCKMKTNGKNDEEVCELSSDTNQVTMTEDGIYYQLTEDHESYEIRKVDYKGKKDELIIETETSSPLNIVGNWIYFSDINDEDEEVMCRVKTNGKDKQEL